MVAKRLAIVSAIADRLEPLAEELGILAPGDPSQFPALFIEDGGQRPDVTTEPGATRYTLDLTIEAYVQGGGGADAYAALHALYLDVIAALLPDPPLGGLAEDINEGEMRVAPAILSKERRLGFALDLEIRFVADRDNPSA